MNSDTLPANVSEGLGPGGQYAQQRVIASSFTLFENGSYAWDFDQVNLLNGAPDPAAIQGKTRTLGRYTRRDSLVDFPWLTPTWIVGDTLYMRDGWGFFTRGFVLKYVRSR